MWGLLLSTVLTSAVDGLNPTAITQQFILQGLVKKPKHIWYFIIPTGVVNLISGFLAYYGVIRIISHFFGKFVARYGTILFGVEVLLGVSFLVVAGVLLKRNLRRKRKDQPRENDEHSISGEERAALKIKSVSPPALMMLGVGATIMELTTALPYFAFLAILFNYQLTFPQLALILVLYNFIYTLPLMILYYMYKLAQDKFDYLYQMIKDKTEKFAKLFIPVIVSLIGVVLIYHAVSL